MLVAIVCVLVMLLIGSGFFAFARPLGIPDAWQLSVADGIGSVFSVFGKDLKSLRFEVDAIGGLVGWVTAKLSVEDVRSPTVYWLSGLLVANYLLFILATRADVLTPFEFGLEKSLVEGFVQAMTTTRTLMLGLLLGVIAKWSEQRGGRAT